MPKIASIIKLIIANTKPEIIASGEQQGKPGKAKYIIARAAADEASARVKALPDKFPVYPELDLSLLQAHFG